MKRRPPNSTRSDTLFPYTRSSDLGVGGRQRHQLPVFIGNQLSVRSRSMQPRLEAPERRHARHEQRHRTHRASREGQGQGQVDGGWRSEEHTSELQSLMRISYAVFCLKKKKILKHQQLENTQ